METNPNLSLKTEENENSQFEIEESEPKSRNIEEKVFGNDVIMRRILRFLNFENVKKCRAVCTMWKNLTEFRIRKTCQIVFNDQVYLSTRKALNMDDLFQNTQITIPFTAYKFEGSCKSFPRFRKALFFKQSRKFVKHLTLKNVTFKHTENALYNNVVDLGFIPSMITVLRIAHSDYGCKWTVPLDTLVSIQVLDLENCAVFVPTENWKIFPTHLSLKDVTFFRDGKKIENNSIDINDLVDFWRIEMLDLDGRIEKIMSMDLSNLPSIDVLKLSYVRILNWGQFQCKITSLSLRGVPYTQKHPNLSVKNLKIDCSTVELSSLPQTLERLQLTRNNVTCTDPILFRNVTFLKYSKNETDPIVASIPNLDIFVNLVDISLKSPYTPIPLDLATLPKMIKRMKLDNIMIIGDGVYHLDTLIIKNGYWIDCRKLLDKLKPISLALYRKHCSNLFRIRDIERILIFIEKPFKTITLGKIEWRDDDEFAKSNFSSFVDRKAEYYTFIEQKGQAINEQQFKNVVKLKF